MKVRFYQPASSDAPANAVILIGNGAKLSRQVGTGFLGSKDMRETLVSVPQFSSPPIIMMNCPWVVVVVVLVEVVTVVVVVLDVLVVPVLVVLIVGKERWRSWKRHGAMANNVKKYPNAYTK